MENSKHAYNANVISAIALILSISTILVQFFIQKNCLIFTIYDSKISSEHGIHEIHIDLMFANSGNQDVLILKTKMHVNSYVIGTNKSVNISNIDATFQEPYIGFKSYNDSIRLLHPGEYFFKTVEYDDIHHLVDELYKNNDRCLFVNFVLRVDFINESGHNLTKYVDIGSVEYDSARKSFDGLFHAKKMTVYKKYYLDYK